jgi:dienelactone hydrolase
MTKTENYSIAGSCQKPILMDIFHNDAEAQPAVIFSHGFKGFKNWGHFDLVARQFAENGFAFVKFNFSLNGTTPEQPSEFADLDAFGKNNFSIELDDLGLVIDYIEKNAAKYSIDPARIYLLGHSRGGGISILKACEDSRIKKLVTWASIKDVEDFFHTVDAEQWYADGIIYTFNSRTNQDMPLQYQFYKNYLMNKTRLDIPNAARNLKLPWLIVHGTKDTSVSFYAAEQLHEWNAKSELLLIEDADHTFGGKHPWESDALPEYAAFAIQKTIDFLHR